MGEEKRRRSRLEYEDRVLCYSHLAIEETHGQGLKMPVRIRVHDISYSGLGIYTNVALNKGDMLKFNLNHRGEVKEVKVEVKWCRYSNEGYKVGLEFLEPTKELILFLNKLIKSL